MSRIATRSAKKALVEPLTCNNQRRRFKLRFPEATYPVNLYTAPRPLLASINKQVFDDIKLRAPHNEQVLAKLKAYQALSHKDKVAAAEFVSDLRVSYFHFVRFRFWFDIYKIQIVIRARF
jgi:hypothetical protein